MKNALRVHAAGAAIFFAVLVGSLSSPAPAGDANSAADANQPAKEEMKLDRFLSRYNSYVADYKEANTPAKKADVVEKMRKAVQADAKDFALTMSGQVLDAKVRKDGSVAVTLATVEELQKLREKPVAGVFRSGAQEWAQGEGGLLVLTMTKEQAASIKKGDKWSLQARAVVQTGDDPNNVKSSFVVEVHMAMPIRIVRNTSEQNINVCQLAFPRYSCIIAGNKYESAGAE